MPTRAALRIAEQVFGIAILNLKETEMSRTQNDDRSDSMNPNNDAYWDSLDNHSNQLNPNNDAYQGLGETIEDLED